MTAQTFSHNGATITVQTQTGQAYLDAQIVQVQLGAVESTDVRRRVYLNRFAEVYSQSAIDGDLGFPWPGSPFEVDALREAFEGWLALPGPVVEQWLNALSAVDTPPNDPDLLPPGQVEKKGSKASK